VASGRFATRSWHKKAPTGQDNSFQVLLLRILIFFINYEEPRLIEKGMQAVKLAGIPAISQFRESQGTKKIN
jgi:hypothetical protein